MSPCKVDGILPHYTEVISASMTKLIGNCLEFCIHVSLGEKPIKNVLATVLHVIAVFIDIQKDREFLLRQQKRSCVVNLF